MKTKKTLLIITPYFAPQSHAAVFRAYKVAKYLPQHGWEVHVLTVDKNYLYNEDPSMLTNLPRQVTIHTAKYVEPTLRGLRMALGGRDRSFKTVKNNLAAEGALDFRDRLSVRIYNTLRRKLNSPDAFWTWRKPAYRKATEIIKKYGVDVVMTSSSPFSTIEIGRMLQQQTGVKWVADFRDPLTYSKRFYSSDSRIFQKQSSIEKMAVEYADAVTTLTSAHPLILADKYGADKVARTHYIATGLDPELLSKTTRQSAEDPYFIFVGEFDPQYGDEFFRIFQETYRDDKVRSEGVRIKFVGRKETNEFWVLPLVRKFKCDDLVDFVDHIPQKQVYELIQNSVGAILCISRVYPWWCSFAKLADYIALEKPVIAIVPDPSESRKWLQLTGLGVFLDGSVQKCAESLKNFILDRKTTISNKEYQKQFLAGYQAAEFDKIMSGLINPPSRPE